MHTENRAIGIATQGVDVFSAKALELVVKGFIPTFTADAADFRLAAEALRINYAGLYDPMAAVHSSAVDPLPHQIRAVYGELLPRIPLRFLLADDPGAGKTIMAGLYLKELLLRSALKRALIIAPGGLVDQWCAELEEKFGLRFDVFDPAMVHQHGWPDTHPFLVAKMDQVARREDLVGAVAQVDWDVVVVDEAHRMSAHYSSWAGGVKATRRFELGRALVSSASNALLMTATPHAGKEEDFQLFMSLLDPDRFEGEFRSGVHTTDTEGLMRRMVKEDLLTFEGKPLFPERRAYTVVYDLTDAERALYDDVTDYVRTQMGRAERIKDRKRGNAVGFALMVLQRRLASSPEAIVLSLKRRRDRLDERARLLEQGYLDPVVDPRLSEDDVERLSSYDEEYSAAEVEDVEQEVLDAATASQTVEELRAEIAALDALVAQAQSVRNAEEDSKWVQLRSILNTRVLGTPTADGAPRKLIVFTEHRDTLDYLNRRITALLGSQDAVVAIHGGVARKERTRIQEEFTRNPNVVVLVATDAAGEGLNLQRAHLMVNYDLPWNPNRIEQRFGRIHRIGQREVCHLWNLVAGGTREGDVFAALLGKIEVMGQAYNGSLFNVLGNGDAFENESLKDLLVMAIRYGDDPATRRRMNEVIDAGITHGLRELVEETALDHDTLGEADVAEIKRAMEVARERKLQPGAIDAFVRSALERFGGGIFEREQGRYEVTHVPAAVCARAQAAGGAVARSYERVAFSPQRVSVEGAPEAVLLAPGHPLLDALVNHTIEQLSDTLTTGTVLVDRRDNPVAVPHLVYIVEQTIHTAGAETDVVSHHFDYVVIPADPQETDVPVETGSSPAHLSFDAASEEEYAYALANGLTKKPAAEVTVTALREAYEDGALPRLGELARRRNAELDRTAQQVRERLTAESNRWYSQAMRLAGDGGKRDEEISEAAARRKGEELQERLGQRLADIERQRRLVAAPGVIRGVALVLPPGIAGPRKEDKDPDTFAISTEESERRGVDLTMAAERALGRTPEEMPHNNKGFDIRSTDANGDVYFIEVKARTRGAELFTVTVSEIQFAQNQGEDNRHILSLVSLSPDGPAQDDLRYVDRAFDGILPGLGTGTVNEKWAYHWNKGIDPRA
ncbi:helicase-related protein [Corynebacterium sanguinis]|uniref:helicase-related protein n=1 Tax=Corynebacterium sanguinis TaxID=2594913 RepID=UPI0021A86424|nr:helicase-related protein [Corynebacterium sanguinis]MCT1464020.1 SNF2-related protein [Corynebacterium sanguinis]MCT2330276.1 SNF2-related protein [Corynebacterium sanguinis]